MNAEDILKETLKLSPQDRIVMVDGLLHSLDSQDPQIALCWAEEAERRLESYRAGGSRLVGMNEVFKDD